MRFELASPMPGSLEVLRAVQALEHSEEARRLAHVEADPVVGDEVDRNLAVHASPDADHRGVLALGELDRVPEQVREHLAQERRIGFYDGSSPSSYSTLRLAVSPSRSAMTCLTSASGSTFTSASGCGQATEREQVVDELLHAPGVHLDALHELARLRP